MYGQNIYVVHVCEILGGFAKVKLAYHALTGEKVAIKIMDKRSLGVSVITKYMGIVEILIPKMKQILIKMNLLQEMILKFCEKKNSSHCSTKLNVILYKFLMWRFCFLGRLAKSENRNRSHEGPVSSTYL